MAAVPLPSGASSPGARTSYAQILRSSAVIGGATALTLIVGLVRTKALAVLLGPAGIGLLGIFSSIADLARSLAQLGINASGVRQIAEAVGSGDEQRLVRTITVLRRVAIGLGLLGTVALIALSGQVSRWAFASDQHAGSIAWLSLAVFFRLVADGQAAMFQGMRRIGELARIGIYGALAGAAVSIVLAAVLGQDGVVPGLVATAALSTLISWLYARSVRFPPQQLSPSEVRAEAAGLLKLGLAFMSSALLVTGAAFVVRALVLRMAGVDAAGHYQAAWTLGGLYVGFVLQAMGTDFYPRLVGAINEPQRANAIVNEQAHVSLLLAGPGVVATLGLAGVVVNLLYSAQFAPAVEVLRWICLGMALRVVSWPIGYIIVAKNKQVLFFAAELAWTVVNLSLSWLCVSHFGLNGAGIAFFGSYVFHVLMVYPIARKLTGFQWSRTNRRAVAVFALMTGLAFASLRLLPPAWAAAFTLLMLLCSGIYSIRQLRTLVEPDDIPGPLRRILAVFGPAAPRKEKP